MFTSLIPRAWEYVTLHGKGKVAVMIKLRILTREVILNDPGGSNVVTGVPIRGRREGQSQRRCDSGSRDQSEVVAGWRHEPRPVGSF